MASSRRHGPQEYGAQTGEHASAVTVAGPLDDGADGVVEGGLARPRGGRRAAAEPGRNATVRAARTRRAQLRIVHVDPWSAMKTTFLLSIALGIVVVVAVAIIWGVLGAAGVWDSINSAIGQVADSPNDPTPFDITHYIGTSRVVGFALIASVIDVVLFTAIATLGAFVYNLAASLVGGLEMTFTEDR
jgi:hypothetical protein